jgi:peptidoglycan/LPS O-acetylase OafA/YrhL
VVISYRPALDGLRAAAVTGVIIYHLEYPWLPGGFLGVDLFFVLSGYLITALLLDELRRRGRIDVGAFWARRARRLLPALLVTLAATALAIRTWIPVVHWPALRDDILASLFYFANWRYIATEQSYFGTPESLAPLRHTWSLAVEEQFYLVWPLLVILAWTLGRAWPATRIWIAGGVGLAITGSALALALTYDPVWPTRAYIASDTRAQQLLIGAALAVALARWPAFGRRSAAPVGLAASAVLLAFAVTMPSTGPFYYKGGATLAALASAALIWSVQTAPAAPLARFIAIAPARWIGKISYGLYLWHWPVIVFMPLAVTGLANTWLNVARVAATVVLAAVCYAVVENPVRRGRPRLAVGTPGRVAIGAALSVALVAGVGIAATTMATGGRAEELAAAKQPEACPGYICLRAVASPSRPVVALIGDSVAQSLDAGMMDLARRNDWTYVLARHGCGLANLRYMSPKWTPTHARPEPNSAKPLCVDDTPQRLQQIFDTYHPSLVVATSRWELRSYIAADNRIINPPSSRWYDDTHAGLRHFAEMVKARGADLVLLDILPVSTAIAQCADHPDGPGCSPPPDSLTATANTIFDEIPREVPGTRTISMNDVVCPHDRCPPVIDGRIIRYDGVHFTPDGARWFARHLESRLLRD